MKNLTNLDKEKNEGSIRGETGKKEMVSDDGIYHWGRSPHCSNCCSSVLRGWRSCRRRG